jgi:superfamily II DNA or RNA helicase
MTVLRPYQVEVVGRFWRTVGTGRRRVILVAPTGSGKTVIAGDIVHRVVAEGGRALVLAHRREIVSQTCHKLDDIGISYALSRPATRPMTQRASRLQVFRRCMSAPSGARRSRRPRPT